MNLFPMDTKNFFSNKRIVIIDDDDRYRFALKRKLSLHGFKNLRLEKTPPSVDTLLGTEACDLILLDIHSDDTYKCDGIGALTAYRRGGVDSCIVMVSGDESPFALIKSLREGADDYWIKGIRLDIPYEIAALFSRQRRNYKRDLSPLDVIPLGYLRTLSLSSEEIGALALSAKRMTALGEPDTGSPLFSNKYQLWTMMHQIFQKLMVTRLPKT